MRDEDAYSLYLKDITGYPRITPVREQELSHVIQSCSNEEQVEAAVHELIQSNLRLVVHCQKEFDKYLTSGVARISALDLIAEGNIGLMKAARNFKTDLHSDAAAGGQGRPVRFSTYACKCIKSHMMRAIKKARFIHIPEHHFGYWSELESIRQEHGETVSNVELSGRLDISSEALSLIKLSARSGVCMLEELTAADSDSNWSDFIASENMACPATAAGHSDLQTFLVEEMQALPPRTRQIISLLYFNEQAPTLKDLSRRFGISSERCRQICVQGLNRLRRQMFSRRRGIEPGLACMEPAAA